MRGARQAAAVLALVLVAGCGLVDRGDATRDERKSAEAQKQRADALQQKLDALTDLEKSLADRAAAGR